MSSIKRMRGVFGLVGAAVAAAGAVTDLRAAKGKRDRLGLVNAIANILVVITGAALAVRSLREGGDNR